MPNYVSKLIMPNNSEYVLKSDDIFVIEGQDIDSQDPLEHTFKHEASGITTSTTDAI